MCLTEIIYDVEILQAIECRGKMAFVLPTFQMLNARN